MIYLSKGLLQERHGSAVTVNRHGRAVTLHGTQARDWLEGRHGPQYRSKTRIRELAAMGLVEAQPGERYALDVFRALCNCILTPYPKRFSYMGLNEREKDTLRWLTLAGLRLTAAELVRLSELGLKPETGYLGEDNRQRLVEAIYCADNIEDGALEAQMEKSSALAATVSAVLTLVKKKRIVLL